MERFHSTDKLYAKRGAILAMGVAAILLLAGAVLAQEHKIIDIRVAGNVSASEKTIRDIAALKIGSELTGTMVQDAVKNLYAKGIFRDISVDMETVSAGVVVIFKVSEYPQLTGLGFKGNTKIKDKDIIDLIKLVPGTYLTDHLIVQAKNKIAAEYMSKGYYLVEVNTSLKYSEDSTKADLEFQITEFDKVKVEKVALTGAEKLKADDLIGKMSNRKKGLFRSSDFKEEKYPEDKEKIVAYCNNKGYMDAYIISDSLLVDSSRNRMTIYVDLYEGPRYYFGRATFTGNDTVYAGEQLLRVLKHTEGAVFSQEKYDQSLGEIYAAYQEKGYLHCRILDRRQTTDSLINIEYEITEGLASQVHLVSIGGNTKTKEKIIRREMMLKPGMTFQRSILMRSLRDIMQLNFFSDVVPEVVDLPSGDVDLSIKVEEKPTGQVSAGAGYSATDKLVGTFGLGIPNFRGNGQNISLSVDFGSRRNSISLSFTEPWFLGTPTSLGAEIYNLNRNWYDYFIEGRRGGAVRVGRRLRWPDNYFRAYVRYRLEDVRYYDFDDDYASENGETVINSHGEEVYIPYDNSLLAFDEAWLRTSAASFTIERDSRNLPVFATSGSRMSYTGEVCGGILGGRWEYYKHLFYAGRYLPLKWGIALGGHVHYGYVSATDNNLIPYSERFTPGGVDTDGTVRGYPDASLAPRSSAGSILGGMSMAVYNLELTIPVMKDQIYALLFADAGSAWLSKAEIKPFSHLYKSYGAGFRLVIPGVGIIGFDFGYALDELRNEERGWRPHFQISQGF